MGKWACQGKKPKYCVLSFDKMPHIAILSVGWIIPYAGPVTLILRMAGPKYAVRETMQDKIVRLIRIEVLDRAPEGGIISAERRLTL